MNRFGRLLLGLLVLAGIGFVAMLRLAPVRTAPPPGPALPPEPAAPIALPVAGVSPTALTDSFRDPRGEGRVHGAIDIMAARGTAVLAAAGGRIEKLFESARGGHTLYMRTPDGRWGFYYAHLDAYAPGLREGAYVPRGAPVATVGSTGDADPAGPHLHFEIRRMAPGDGWWQGAAIDPYPLLVPRGGGTRLEQSARR